MQFKIKHAVVIGARHAGDKYPNTHYLELRTAEGDTWNLSTDLLSVDQARGLILQSVAIEGVLSGSVYDRQQRIKLVSGTFTPVGVASK
ncbi:MAG: hypothetical protein KME04_02125 [Pleurocapsa minor GSE-CHR-MK-17-07R]|jgi:hypothetical protein|nr:hypothetical protein [Pleurocapsa minor GSE-CHR-MK 17-07R]MBW4435901.1 hypothetical protein [Pleurocapsa minor GSE-CHR-MK 17-07R]